MVMLTSAVILMQSSVYQLQREWRLLRTQLRESFRYNTRLFFLFFPRFRINSDYTNRRDTRRHLETNKISKQTRTTRHFFPPVFTVKIMITFRCSLLPAVGHNGNKKENGWMQPHSVSLCRLNVFCAVKKKKISTSNLSNGNRLILLKVTFKTRDH